MKPAMTLLIAIISIALFIPLTYAQNDLSMSVSDRGNTNSAADIFVHFEGALPDTEIAVFVLPSGTVLDIDSMQPSASLNPVSRYMPLPDDALASDGTAIEEDVAYDVYVRHGDEMAGPLPLTLRNEATVFTVVAELDAAAGGLEVDADGNIFFADFGEGDLSPGDKVYKITPNGDISVFLEGNNLLTATGNAFDSAGNFYQSSFAQDAVIRVTPDGQIATFATEGLRSPVGIAIDDDDNLFVANCAGASIQRITPEGESSRLTLDVLFSCANGITLDEDGNVYVSNFRGSRVLKTDQEGNTDVLAVLPGNNNAHILYHDGLLYIVSRGEHQIFTITLDGEVELFAGTGERGNDDGPALAASFTLPNDLAISPDGSILYVNGVASASSGTNYPSVIRGIVLQRPE